MGIYGGEVVSGDKPTPIGKASSDARLWTPEHLLQDALGSSIGKRGAFENGKKMLILALDDDGQYSVSFMQAGMKMSECVALCEVAKSIFLAEMGYNQCE